MLVVIRALTLLSVILIAVSCRKDEAEQNDCTKDYSGSYESELRRESTVLGVLEEDTTFVDTLIVSHLNDLVEIDIWDIPQDSICSEQLYGQTSSSGNALDWYEVRFYGDSIYYKTRLGSNWTWTIYTYKGRKY